jgi:flagellar assembly protein FliH
VRLGAPVVNAGDGSNEHPTQALVDIAAMRRDGLDGRTVVLMGNLRDHRVHHSLARLLGRQDVRLVLVTPHRFELLDADARNAALAEVESIQAMALSTIGQALAAAAPALAQVAQAHRQQAAELALVAARVVSASALDRHPEAPLQAALEALGQEIDASPRLVIRTGDLTEATHARIQQLCADAGFSGIVAFRTEPAMAPAAFQLEWADGRAAFDPEDAFTRMSEALSSALAAEAGHAENLSPETSTEGRP